MNRVLNREFVVSNLYQCERRLRGTPEQEIEHDGSDSESHAQCDGERAGAM